MLIINTKPKNIKFNIFKMQLLSPSHGDWPFTPEGSSSCVLQTFKWLATYLHFHPFPQKQEKGCYCLGSRRSRHESQGRVVSVNAPVSRPASCKPPDGQNWVSYGCLNAFRTLHESRRSVIIRWLWPIWLCLRSQTKSKPTVEGFERFRFNLHMANSVLKQS